MKGEGDLLISIYSRHWFPHRLITYTWDHRGNLLADGAFTYTYSAAGRMVRAESLAATLVYTYNADGLRVARSQSVSSVQSVDTFTWDWATPVPELLSDGESLYLIGYDTLGWQTGADWTFVLQKERLSQSAQRSLSFLRCRQRRFLCVLSDLCGEKTGNCATTVDSGAR